ncbi:MAG: LLM class F420-dependent oxidoreductase [Acidimicrobiia bacterium]
MELGILSPVLSLVPGSHSEWEQDATIDDVRRIAEAADRLGYGYLTCSEHVAIPVDGLDLPGPRYWDPLSTFGYLAAHTSRIRFTTSVLVLPYHHPLDIAKRYGTLDRICNGRLVLGVGVGYLEPEFRMLGAPFDDRGARTDDAIRALRASFGRAHPTYDGEFFSFDGFVVDPCGVQEQVPLWVGGRTQRSLRRAVALGDGWCPFAVSPRRAAAWLADAAETEAWHQRERPLDVILGTRRAVDPLGAPDEAAERVAEVRDAGATKASLWFVHHSLDHYLEQLEAMIDVVAGM